MEKERRKKCMLELLDKLQPKCMSLSRVSALFFQIFLCLRAIIFLIIAPCINIIVIKFRYSTSEISDYVSCFLLQFFRALAASCVLYYRTKHSQGFSIC